MRMTFMCQNDAQIRCYVFKKYFDFRLCCSRITPPFAEIANKPYRSI